MHRFCYQCRETGENKGCMIFGACGKSDETANLQDLLIQTLREIALAAVTGEEIRFAQMVAQRRSDIAQNRVADRVSVAVIDLLEVVHVTQRQ